MWWMWLKGYSDWWKVMLDWYAVEEVAKGAHFPGLWLVHEEEFV